MARNILNRKDLGKQSEAPEGSVKGAEQPPAEDSAPQEAQPTKLLKPTKRSKKADKEVRLKAFWGVFNQNLRRVALFEYSERKQADKKAEELTQSTKIPHFVQLVKEVIQD
jgi:hypothetical protein